MSCDGKSMVQTVPGDQSTSSSTPSTSGASTPTYCGSYRRVSKAKKRLHRSRYLLAIEDRNRLRKLAVRKIRNAANGVSALTLLRWEEKIDRKFEKKIEQQRVKLERLKQINELLSAKQRIFKHGCTVLEDCVVMLQVKLAEEQDGAASFPYASSPHHDYFYSPH
ncbi:unnamed protein product [Nippostrongylus brasiliensis]|uniref:BZIP domain-containing protein n=1 Tax=Nippostrongylus brasiliensis TaxID=27835 RepID=A0A0N4Y6E8_NIPBR|nr:unnamed protein product [Nippostrongylus brasiliensis]